MTDQLTRAAAAMHSSPPLSGEYEKALERHSQLYPSVRAARDEAAVADAAPLTQGARDERRKSSRKRARSVDQVYGEDFSVGDGDAPAASTSRGGSRNLFYQLIVELSRLCTEHRWAVYVTGTTLSMRKVVLERGSSGVSTRTAPVDVAPRHRMSVDDMLAVLAHYFVDLPSYMTDDGARAALECFRGRALHFARHVFDPLMTHVQRARALPSADQWSRMLSESSADARRVWYDRARVVLFANTTLHADGSGTRALLTRLVKCLLMTHGVLRWDNPDPDALDEAMCSGMFAVSLETRAVNVERDEPAVFRGMRDAVLEEVQSGCVLDALVRSASPVDSWAKGGALEHAIAWHIALMGLVAAHASPPRELALVDVLRGLSPTAVSDRLADGLETWHVHATRVIEKADALAFQQLVRADGSGDVGVVLVGLPEYMGVDAAFVVSRPAAGGTEYALVALQFKNSPTATAADVLLTLHPGTQYLYDAARRMLLGLDKETPQSLQIARPCAYRWPNWAALDNAATFLTRDWIRVPVVARPIHADVQAFSNVCADGGNKRAWPVTRGWTRADDDAAARSPVVWVSMHDAASARQDYAACYTGPAFPAAALRALTCPDPKAPVLQLAGHGLWVPRSIADAYALVQRITAANVNRKQLDG